MNDKRLVNVTMFVYRKVLVKKTVLVTKIVLAEISSFIRSVLVKSALVKPVLVEAALVGMMFVDGRMSVEMVLVELILLEDVILDKSVMLVDEVDGAVLVDGVVGFVDGVLEAKTVLIVGEICVEEAGREEVCEGEMADELVVEVEDEVPRDTVELITLAKGCCSALDGGTYGVVALAPGISGL